MSFLDSAEDPGDNGSGRAARRPLFVFVLVTLVVGAGASIFTEPNIPTWYAGLVRPSIAPPNWVFAPVWTTLYIMMAVAAWRVWKLRGLKSPEMWAWSIQLALNFAWSAIFFSLHQIGAALVEIILLDLAILYTTALFFRRDRIAGALMLPYLAWTVFATVLTHAFWQLNP
jgi:tryptophan-rich sensory protein